MNDRRSDRSMAAALTPTHDPAWVLNYVGRDANLEHSIESRFAISNGFLGVRAACEASRGPVWISSVHSLRWGAWPRTFVAGLFDIPETEPPVPMLVPAPDWLRLRILIDGQPILFRTGDLLGHRRTLDMRRGLMITEWQQRHPSGCMLSLRTLRLVSLADRRLTLQLAEFSIDHACEVTVEASLEQAASGVEPERIEPYLGIWRTGNIGRRLATAISTRLERGGAALEPELGDVLQRWRWLTTPGQVATFCRLCAFARGVTNDEVVQSACEALEATRASGWAGVLDAHVSAWAERWAVSDVSIGGDPELQTALRFAAFHLNGAADPTDERVSIGARALTGEGYVGHIFWDTEIYVVPFYTFTWPEAARALLTYRYHTLPAAREKAARMGYRGALYAWESADTGEEVTPETVIGAEGRVIPVLNGTQEQHISADVAYAVWQYWQATGDDEFLCQAGAEILLETARFWASRVALEQDGAYHIRHVIGPDEFHEDVDDNAFTNVMAQWNLERGAEVATLLRARWPKTWAALASRLGFTDDETAQWPQIAAKLYTGFDPATGLFEQFAGYYDLEEIDPARYLGAKASVEAQIGRTVLIGSKIVKQADVVMLLALLEDRFSPAVRRANFRYYETRCAHGSSLSRGSHAWVAARLGNIDMALEFLKDTAAIDLEDATGTSAGGIHIAAQGAIWQTVVFGIAGLSLHDDGIGLDPRLPSGWDSLAFHLRWRGRLVRFQFECSARRVTATLAEGSPMTLHLGKDAPTLQPGKPWTGIWDGQVKQVA
ncbi:MAG: glycoside hydrolase family 65 protein [Chloroflexi bacterium]|nr:glycoside hydrolase family 65 protein [Chloroflexota bacterium]